VADRRVAYYTINNLCLNVEEVMPGTIDTCKCFTIVRGYDYPDYEFEATLAAVIMLILVERYIFRLPPGLAHQGRTATGVEPVDWT
jgi:hypothetical protein